MTRCNVRSLVPMARARSPIVRDSCRWARAYRSKVNQRWCDHPTERRDDAYLDVATARDQVGSSETGERRADRVDERECEVEMGVARARRRNVVAHDDPRLVEVDPGVPLPEGVGEPPARGGPEAVQDARLGEEEGAAAGGGHRDPAGVQLLDVSERKMASHHIDDSGRTAHPDRWHHHQLGRVSGQFPPRQSRDRQPEGMEGGLKADRDSFFRQFVTTFFSVDGTLKATPAQIDEAVALCQQSDQTAALDCMEAFATIDFRSDLTKVTAPALVDDGDRDGDGDGGCPSTGQASAPTKRSPALSSSCSRVRRTATTSPTPESSTARSWVSSPAERSPPLTSALSGLDLKLADQPA